MKYTPEIEFALKTLDILCDHQNVGWNRTNKEFVDPQEAFEKIVSLAKELNLLRKNPDNDILIPVV